MECLWFEGRRNEAIIHQCHKSWCITWVLKLAARSTIHDICMDLFTRVFFDNSGYPDSNVHGANMGPIWGRQDPGGPHVGPMNFAIWIDSNSSNNMLSSWTSTHLKRRVGPMLAPWTLLSGGQNPGFQSPNCMCYEHRDCLLNCLFRLRSKKISKLRVTGLCTGNSPITGEFPAQRASNAENVFIWWRHHRYI